MTALWLYTGETDPAPLNLLDRTAFTVPRQFQSTQGAGYPTFTRAADGLTVSLPILCLGPVPAANWQRIYRKLYEAPLGAGPWGMASANVVLKAQFPGETAFTLIDVTGFEEPVPLELYGPGSFQVLRVTLHCLKYARGAPKNYTGTIAAGGNAIWLPGIPGDVPALTRIQLTDTSGGSKAINGLLFGRHDHPLLVQGDLNPYQAPIPHSPGVAHTDATAYGGTCARLTPTTAAWQPVCRVLGPTTGRMNRRAVVIAKVRDSAAVIGTPTQAAIAVNSITPQAGALASGTYTAFYVPKNGTNYGTPTGNVQAVVANLAPGGTTQVPTNILFYDNDSTGNPGKWSYAPVGLVANVAQTIWDSSSHDVFDMSGIVGPANLLAGQINLPVTPASGILTTRVRFKLTSAPTTPLAAGATGTTPVVQASAFTVGNYNLLQLNTVTTGGVLPMATTYYYVVTAVVGGIEYIIGAQTGITTFAAISNSNANTVYWPAVAGATNYKVYGRGSSSTLLIATVSASTFSYTDTGSITPSGALSAGGTLFGAGVASIPSTGLAPTSSSPVTLTAGVFTADTNWHVAEITYYAATVDTIGNIVIEVDGVPMFQQSATGPPPNLQLGGTGTANGNAYIGEIVVADQYLGNSQSIVNGAAITYGITHASGEGSGDGDLAIQLGAGPGWYKIPSIGNVATYTVSQWPPPNSVLQAYPQITPVLPTQFRLCVGLQAPTPTLIPGPPHTPKLSNGAWEPLDLGGASLPPQPTRQGGTPRPWLFEIQAMNPNGGTTADVDLTILFDEQRERTELDAAANTTPRIWDFDSRADDEASCALLSTSDSSVQGQAAVTSRFHLGPGNAYLVPVLLVNDGNGNQVMDAVNATATVSVTVTPLYSLSGGV